MKSLLVSAAALALTACATAGNRDLDDYDASRAISVDAPRSAAATVESTNPALWQVRDEDTTLYLLGTFAYLPETYEWRTPAIDAAIAASDTLVLETLIDRSDQASAGRLMADLGLARDLPPLLNRVDPALRPTLSNLMARSGVETATYDIMENWAAAFTLYSAHMQLLGLSGAAGVAPDLRAAFSGKRLDQLETNRQQLEAYDALPIEAQRQLLESVILGPDAIKTRFTDMLAAWSSGDLDAIDATFNMGIAPGTALHAALVTQRNRRLADLVRARLATPGTQMVAVNAGALVGPSGVLAALEAAGLTVSRVAS
ncbi:TraB/GumN family protein [Sphingomicrobium sp. XHP0235]|uniref:TraB/GumN family protein n=1 Tax=Sphingomicrobium aquimarinum TaxID=3133971 RepID=UPI0031FEA342